MKQMKFYKGDKTSLFSRKWSWVFTNNKTRAHESNEIQTPTAQKTRAHESNEIQTPSN